MNESFAIHGFGQQNGMFCVIDGEDVVQADYLGNRKKVGKTLKAYQELEDTCGEYYDKLVELGVIIPPKSQEEMMADLQRTVTELMTEIKELKQGEHIGNCKCGGQDVPTERHCGSGAEGTGNVAKESAQ